MDGFSYNNIFETKGIEYLIIISFLFLIIPFWIAINHKAGIKVKIRKTLGVLSDKILIVPLGLFYSRNHTWAHLERTGEATIGLDDFLLHITGEIRFLNLKNKGDFMSKGELMAELEQDGKILRIFSPVSGKIVHANKGIKDNPGILNEDPYLNGWLYKVRPTDWIDETSSYYMADEAVSWFKRELTRFRDFMAESMKKHSPESSMLILQDGGEICDRPLSELPVEIWQDFQKSFLN